MTTATQKTDVLRFKVDTEKLWGIYRGVVEDRDDPLKLGRCRVRVWGVHTEQQVDDGLNKSPWEELVWAHPILPIFEGAVSGQGAFSVPLKGAHVMVFFENGNMMQPRFFGCVPGFPIDANKYSQLEKQDGYVDPDQWYPLDDWIEDHDWPRLARREKLGKTYLALKKDWLDLDVPITFGGEWDEQPPMYETKYPDGNVFATHDEWDLMTSIIVEVDATKGSPRFAWWHPSGSYMEVNKEGRMTFRNKHHRWDICDGICQIHYMDIHHKTVGGDMTCLILMNEYRETMLDKWTEIHQTEYEKIDIDKHKTIIGVEYEEIDSDKHKIVMGLEYEETIGDFHKIVDGTVYEEIGVNKHYVIKGTNYQKTVGNKNDYIVSDMMQMIGDSYFITVGAEYVVYAAGAIAISSESSVDICGETVAMEAGEGEVWIGRVVNIGPIVNLGEECAASCRQPPEPEEPTAPTPPTPPIFSPAPPPVADTPDFIPPEEETVMPIPSCP